MKTRGYCDLDDNSMEDSGGTGGGGGGNVLVKAEEDEYYNENNNDDITAKEEEEQREESSSLGNNATAAGLNVAQGDGDGAGDDLAGESSGSIMLRRYIKDMARGGNANNSNNNNNNTRQVPPDANEPERVGSTWASAVEANALPPSLPQQQYDYTMAAENGGLVSTTGGTAATAAPPSPASLAAALLEARKATEAAQEKQRKVQELLAASSSNNSNNPYYHTVAAAGVPAAAAASATDFNNNPFFGLSAMDLSILTRNLHAAGHPSTIPPQMFGVPAVAPAAVTMPPVPMIIQPPMMPATAGVGVGANDASNNNSSSSILPGLCNTGILSQQELLNALLQTAQGLSFTGSSMLGSMLGGVLPPGILAHLEKSATAAAPGAAGGGGDALANLIQGITALTSSAAAAATPLPMPFPSSLAMMAPPGPGGLGGYHMIQPPPTLNSSSFGQLDSSQLGVLSTSHQERGEAATGRAFGCNDDDDVTRLPCQKQPKKAKAFNRDDVPEDKDYEDFVQKLPKAVLDRRPYRHEPFPLKLYRMLEESEERGMNHAVCFTASGTAFRIVNTRIFERQISPLYFRHSRYSSFRRQLSTYGFTRVDSGADTGAFTHVLFRRGRPELAAKILRSTDVQGREGQQKELEQHGGCGDEENQSKQPEQQPGSGGDENQSKQKLQLQQQQQDGSNTIKDDNDDKKLPAAVAVSSSATTTEPASKSSISSSDKNSAAAAVAAENKNNDGSGGDAENHNDGVGDGELRPSKRQRNGEYNNIDHNINKTNSSAQQQSLAPTE